MGLLCETQKMILESTGNSPNSSSGTEESPMSSASTDTSSNPTVDTYLGEYTMLKHYPGFSVMVPTQLMSLVRYQRNDSDDLDMLRKRLE